MASDAQAFAEVAAAMQGDDGEPVTASRIIELAVTTVPDVDGASLTVRRRRGRYHSLGASCEAVERSDAAQHEMSEGPCVSAVEAADWFRSGDLRHDERWPRWGPVAADLGLHSLLALPLVQGDDPSASLNLYAEHTGAFADPDAVSHAALFATHAAMALRSAQQITGLQTAVASRHVIGMAQGMLIERHGLSPQEAFALLQRVSSTSNRKLREVAEDLLTSGRLPEGYTRD